MSNDDQSKRLAAELELMRTLAQQSGILEFEAEGDAPKEYKIKLLGRGISRVSHSGSEVEYVDVDKSNNYTAKKWFSEQQVVTLPVDLRTLHSRGGPPPANVVRYQRGPSGGRSASGDVLYIDDDTPTPQLPRRPAPPRRPTGDDDIFYIGDD